MSSSHHFCLLNNQFCSIIFQIWFTANLNVFLTAFSKSALQYVWLYSCRHIFCIVFVFFHCSIPISLSFLSLVFSHPSLLSLSLSFIHSFLPFSFCNFVISCPIFLSLYSFHPVHSSFFIPPLPFAFTLYFIHYTF